MFHRVTAGCGRLQIDWYEAYADLAGERGSSCRFLRCAAWLVKVEQPFTVPTCTHDATGLPGGTRAGLLAYFAGGVFRKLRCHDNLTSRGGEEDSAWIAARGDRRVYAVALEITLAIRSGVLHAGGTA